MPPLDEGTPLFVQIAEQLADDIVDGVLAEGARAPSTNELAAFYRINPATAAKGINVLVEDAVLEKRRGIGMFVAPGAQGQLRANRRKRFAEQFVDPMLAEATRLGIDTDGPGGIPRHRYDVTDLPHPLQRRIRRARRGS